MFSRGFSNQQAPSGPMPPMGAGMMPGQSAAPPAVQAKPAPPMKSKKKKKKSKYSAWAKKL